MAVLIGSNDASLYQTAVSTYSSGNGECFYSMAAVSSGMVETLKIRMNTFNTTTQLSIRVRDSLGNLLASGVIASAGGTGERSVSVTPFAVTVGQSYLVGIVANTGSPQPFQSTSQEINNQPGSTFASPQNPLVLPGNTLGAVRKFHMWAEGVAVATPAISVAGSVTPGQPKGWSVSGFSSPVNAAMLDGIACQSVSNTGFTAPGYVDSANNPRPGDRTLTATNGTQSASATVPVGVIAGYTHQTLESVSSGLYSVVKDMGAAVGDFVVFPDSNGNKVTPAGDFETNHEGSQVFWLIKGDTGYGLNYNVLTGPGGEIIDVVRSLTAKSLTMSGLTMRSLTARGL